MSGWDLKFGRTIASLRLLLFLYSFRGSGNGYAPGTFLSYVSTCVHFSVVKQIFYYEENEQILLCRKSLIYNIHIDNSFPRKTE